jgi:hypothetical protein
MLAFWLVLISAILVAVTPARSVSACDELKAAISKSDKLSANLGKPLGGEKWEGDDFPKITGFDECYVSKSSIGTSYICESMFTDASSAQKLQKSMTASIKSCFPESKWFYTRTPDGLLFSSLEGYSAALTNAKIAQQNRVWIQIAERRR